MRFGICTSPQHAALMRSIGWDFVEVNAQEILQPRLDDQAWKFDGRTALPLLAANCLLPGEMKIVGPALAAPTAVREYLDRVGRRARVVGIETIVFGSGRSREIPEGFDRAVAKTQLIEFSKLLAEIGETHGVKFAIEHLRKEESNFINTLQEAFEVAETVNSPAFGVLFDTYHFSCEDESLAHVAPAAELIAHVHVADRSERAAPSLGGFDYRPLFSILRAGGYDKAISVEANNFDVPRDGERVLQFLTRQWQGA